MKKKLLIALLALVTLVVVAVSNEDFRDGFWEGYNSSVEEQE